MKKIEELNVLIVDDELEATGILSRYFKKEGHVATVAHNGAEAVNISQSVSPDVIVMDIRMPEMDGIEALKRIRKINENAIIIMLTAVDDVESAMEAIRGGADDFIRKPINLIELMRSIERNIERKYLISENRDYQKRLEEKVSEQTQRISRLYLNLKKAHLDVIKALIEAIDAKDPYTRGHCSRVSSYSMRMGEALGLSEEEKEALRYGTLLHDIGKIGTNEEILRKPGVLTDEEFEHVKSHSDKGDSILTDVDFLKSARKIVRHHHERSDGSGYPDGLKGAQLDILTKIVIIADAYDAMTSERSYRKGMSRERALSILSEGKGTQFDAELVDMFVENKLYLIDGDDLTVEKP